MPVLLVTPWPLLTPGGGQRLAMEVATALADQGIDVVVAAGSGLSTNVVTPVCAPPVREVRLRLVQPPTSRWRVRRGSAFATAVLDGLDALAADLRPDTILFTPHGSACGHQAAALAARLGVPFLLWPAIHLDQRTHTDQAARRFYRSADVVCCLSAIERQWLLDCAGVSPDRALTLGYGWSGEVAPSLRRPTTGQLRLLTVGAYVPHKQLDHQIDALAQLRHLFGVDAQLTVAGVLSQPAVLDRLRDRVRRHQLDGCVELRTDCTDAEIASLHADAHFFFFTSRSESFGVALVEAIARATVPIVYPHPIYRELVEASGFGLVADAASPRALAEAVVSALGSGVVDADDRRRRWLAERSWRRVVAPIVSLRRRQSGSRDAAAQGSAHPGSRTVESSRR